MTHGYLASNPFVAAGMIEDSRLFVGREDELKSIVSRMTGVQPTSINIYGDKRIGKSSLLYHFLQTWEQRVQNPNHYVVIYLSLRDAKCQTETGFYQELAKALLSSLPAWQNWINNILGNHQSLNRQEFSEFIKQFKQRQKLPVICLDDGEKFFNDTQEFNNGFYDNLRSLIDSNKLMLIIASHKKLDFYSKKYKFTSLFFNLGHVFKLGELPDNEVKELLRLPASTIQNATPALSMDEQRLCKQLGGSHPFLLQIAGGLLCEARQRGHDENWVKEKFANQSKRLPAKLNYRSWRRKVIWLVRDLPVYLGKIPKFIGGTVDDVSNWIIGCVILLMLILVFVRLLNLNEVWDFIKENLGINGNQQGK